MRAVFCPGQWQIISAAAALAQHHSESVARREDVLVLYDYCSPEIRTKMEVVARVVWPWKSIIWSEDVLASHYPARLFFPVAREVLHNRLGKSVAEVWVTKLFNDATKFVLQAYSNSQSFLYEDGISEYNDWPLACGTFRGRGIKDALRYLRREASHFRAAPECMDVPGSYCKRSVQHLTGFYSFLGQYLPIPPCLEGVPVVQIDQAVMRGRLHALMSLVQPWIAPYRDGGPTVVILEDPYAAYDVLDEEVELALYDGVITLLAEAGYRILWKTHPRRSEVTIFPKLKTRHSSVPLELFDFPPELPMECLLNALPLAGVVGCTTSSLLYVKGLSKVPSICIANRIDPAAWKMEVYQYWAKMFADRLPGVESLPEVEGGAHP